MSVLGAELASSTRRTPRGAALRRRSVQLGVLAVVLVVVTLALPVFLPSPTRMSLDATLQAPSWSHVFGTDEFGRDLFTRIVYGARVSWLIALCAAFFSLVIGGTLGATAALSGRFVDSFLMRVVDVLLAFPAIVLALVLATAIGPGEETLIIVVSVVYSAPVARFVRGLVRKEASLEYVSAARMIGSRRRRILGFHVGINVLPTVLVYQMTIAADAILVEAALSYLGAGVRPPTPAWGSIIQEGQALVLGGTWWVSLFPGVAITLTALVLNALSDAVIDELSVDR
jgi:ABC-type dipeptide/oligopeptide/nickel transport system permease subunit